MKLFLGSLLISSSNKVRTPWEIIKVSTGKSQLYVSVTKINSEAGLITDTRETVNIFNKFSLKMAENLNNKYSSLCRALQLLEKSNVVEVLAMKLFPVSDIEVISTVTFLKKEMLQGMMVFLIKY